MYAFDAVCKVAQQPKQNAKAIGEISGAACAIEYGELNAGMGVSVENGLCRRGAPNHSDLIKNGGALWKRTSANP